MQTAPSGIGYDELGRRQVTGVGSANSSYAYDQAGRLQTLNHNFTNGVGNASSGFEYNPAGQISHRTQVNDDFSIGSPAAVSRPYSVDSLNRYTSAGSASFTYDGNGNLTGDGTSGFGYDAENRLITASNGTTLTYDPLGRLWQVQGAQGTRQLLYAGSQLAAEYDNVGNVARRWFWGPGTDEPMLEDSGASLNCSGTRFLLHDERGSIVAEADCWGNRQAVNAYDEYGIPSNNTIAGRFGYTGQMWLPELGLWYYKARIYSPTMGRFLQTDPIGYGNGLNWYAYTHNDPINSSDPNGLDDCGDGSDDICVPGSRPPRNTDPGASGVSFGHSGQLPSGPADNMEATQRAALKKPQKPKAFTCADAMKQPGKIKASSIGLTAVGAIGLTGGVGTWTNLSTGAHGFYKFVGFGAGLAVGGTYSPQVYTSISAFTGMSDGVSIGFSGSVPGTPFSIGVGYTASWNSSGSGSGLTVDVGLRGIPYGGAMATYTDTEIFGCKR